MHHLRWCSCFFPDIKEDSSSPSLSPTLYPNHCHQAFAIFVFNIWRSVYLTKTLFSSVWIISLRFILVLICLKISVVNFHSWKILSLSLELNFRLAMIFFLYSKILAYSCFCCCLVCILLRSQLSVLHSMKIVSPLPIPFLVAFTIYSRYLDFCSSTTLYQCNFEKCILLGNSWSSLTCGLVSFGIYGNILSIRPSDIVSSQISHSFIHILIKLYSTFSSYLYIVLDALLYFLFYLSVLHSV